MREPRTPGASSDINFVRRTARIERTAQLIDGKWEVRPPKSAAGIRTAESPPRDLVSALQVLTADLAPSHYVFDTPAEASKPGVEARPSHPCSHANFMRRVFDPAGRTVGLPTGRTKGGVGAHDLRHFYASMCIEAGMSPVDVARRLGHADPTLVLRTYAHMWEQTDDRWAEVFDGVLAGSTAPTNVVTLRATR